MTEPKTAVHPEQELAKFDAEAEAARALARKYAATARKEEAYAEQAEIGLRELKRQEKIELAKDFYHHVLHFDMMVNEVSVKQAIAQLTLWEREADGKPIHVEMILNSPGGDVFEGFALIDFLVGFRQRGNTVTTVALGMAASMAGVILQAGDKRVMGKNSFLLIHQAQFGAAGSYGEVQDRVKLVDMMQDRILNIFAARSSMKKPELAKKWKRTDWWIPSEEALKLGLVDEVR